MQEDDFELQFEEIKNNENIVIRQPQKQNKNKEKNNMKKIKNFNYKKLIEQIKTLIIYTAIIGGIAYWLGLQAGLKDKADTAKVIDTVNSLKVQK